MTTITKYLEKDLTTDILLKTKKRNVNERTKLDKIIHDEVVVLQKGGI